MILNRYLFKEISLSFLATLLVLTLIIVGNTFIRLLANASNGEIPTDLLSEMLLYGSLRNLIRLIPIALLIGMMLAFSRLYRDSEMTALRASGFSPKHFYQAISTVVLPITLILAGLIFFFLPYLEQQNLELRKEVNERPESAGIPAGEFTTASSSRQRHTILAEDIDASKTTMERFFVQSLGEDTESLIWARTATLFIDSVNEQRFLQIHDGHRYEIDRATGEMTIIQFGEHGIRIPLRNYTNSQSISTVPTLTLLNTAGTAEQAELQWRIAIVLSAPILAFLAFPLSYTAPRQGRYSKIAIAILIYGIYANVLASLKGSIEEGNTPIWLGMWWVHAVMIAMSYWLLRKYYGRPS